MNKFCVSLTCAKDNTDKATVAFVIANAAVASDKDAMVFLSTEGVHLATKGYSDGIHEEGFSPLKELMDNFIKAGGKVFVCSPCYKKRGYGEDQLIEGATMIGGAMLVEFLTTNGGSGCITY